MAEVADALRAYAEEAVKARDREWVRAFGWNPDALRPEDQTPEHMAEVMQESAKAMRESAEEEVKAERERLTREVPTNWLDPLLTGKAAALHGSGPWGCPDIERLLRGIRNRLRASSPSGGGGERPFGDCNAFCSHFVTGIHVDGCKAAPPEEPRPAGTTCFCGSPPICGAATNEEPR